MARQQQEVGEVILNFAKKAAETIGGKYRLQEADREDAAAEGALAGVEALRAEARDVKQHVKTAVMAHLLICRENYRAS
jgi:hypothetical protein